MLRTEVLTGNDWVTSVRGKWEDLLADSAFPTPFHQLEWLQAVDQTYSPGSPHIILLCAGNELVGALPLVERKFPLRSSRPLATGPSDYLHPIYRIGREHECEAAMRDYFEGIRNQTIDLHQQREDVAEVPEGQKWHARTQARCLVLDLPNSFETYLDSLGKSLKYEAKRFGGKAYREMDARFVDADESNWKECLDKFFSLHVQRWRKRGLPGAFFGKSKSLHYAWVPNAISNGWIWLRILESNGDPFGAIYAMKSGDTCFFYQAGFDPSFGKLSPGSVLVASMIERAIQEGCTRFDFLRGDEPYKRRWKPQHAYENRRFIRPAQGIAGQLALKSLTAAADVEDRLRARLEGKSLWKNRTSNG